MADSELLEKCVGIVHEASRAALDVYNSGDFDVEIKADNTPLTRADKQANQIISAGLKKISDLPIMSEEGEHEVFGQSFWCIDPIDGTKDFINKTDEFTINIGLIENGEPVLGVVGVPARNLIYFGAKNHGAFKQVGSEAPVDIKAQFDGQVPIIVNHHTVETELKTFLDKLGEHQLIVAGSSLKFCLVAEGAAAIYPRFYGSHLWDTAAADAVLRAAGGKTVATTTGEPLVYDPIQLNNPLFIASANNYKFEDFVSN